MGLTVSMAYHKVWSSQIHIEYLSFVGNLRVWKRFSEREDYGQSVVIEVIARSFSYNVLLHAVG